MTRQDLESAIEVEMSMAQIRDWLDGTSAMFVPDDLMSAFDEAQGACHQGKETQYIVIRVER